MSREIIAILRGISPKDAADIAEVLLDAGITRIEVPLNSPNPFDSISAMANNFSARGSFGAGTLLDVIDIKRLQDAGGEFVVSPNCDTEIIAATKAAGLQSYPGVFTASECFAALKAGADGLKIFPANIMGPAGIKALRAVLPAKCAVYAVGGAAPDNFSAWFAAGATGFGLGSYLFTPDMALSDIASRAKQAVLAFDQGA